MVGTNVVNIVTGFANQVVGTNVARVVTVKLQRETKDTQMLRMYDSNVVVVRHTPTHTHIYAHFHAYIHTYT